MNARCPWGCVLVLALCFGCRSAPDHASPEPSTSRPATRASAGAIASEPRAESAGAPATLGSLRAHHLGVAIPSARAVVVLLHGFGDQGDGLVPLGAELANAREGLAVVALEALLPHPRGGRMWWPIDIERVRAARLRGAWPELERERPAGADDARDAVVSALRALGERGVPRERVVLAGFSQGAMLSVDVALTHPELLVGAVAWSGAVIDREQWEQRSPEGVRFVVVHGQRDAMLPFSQGESLHSLLSQVSPGAAWVPFDGPHTVSSEGQRALLDLLARVDAPAPP